uniref:Uncharacterized protein n=1 Tax=Anopheles farauti TaxID=69004 RepID=A0A182QVG6_9DIPT
MGGVFVRGWRACSCRQHSTYRRVKEKGMSPDRRLYLLVVYICAIQLRLSIGGNPRDSAQVSARNAPSGTSSSSGSVRNSSNITCQEDVLDQCPPNASCDKGQCVCLFGYKLNPAYHGKNGSGSSAQPSSSVSSTNVASHTYCLLDESGTKAASMYGGGGSSSSNSSKATGDGLASGDSSGTADQLPLREPVGAHHILGGVLIPLAFVVILIGSAILAKRTDLWSRLRQRFLAHRNRHRRRPAYEDVVLVGFEPQAGRL